MELDRDYTANERIDGPGQSKTRILIVDDEPLFREMLFVYLTRQESLQVIGAVADGTEAVRIANEACPDVVVMDFDLKVQPDGLRAAHQIKSTNPGVGIVVLSSGLSLTDIEFIRGKKSTGWAFLLKQNIRHGSTLLRAIETAAWGNVSVDPALLTRAEPDRATVLERLTQKQMSVLKEMATGFSDRAIARRLSLTEAQASEAIESVYNDLHIADDDKQDRRVTAVLMFLRKFAFRPGK